MKPLGITIALLTAFFCSEVQSQSQCREVLKDGLFYAQQHFQSNTACIERWEACDYQLSVGPIFEPVSIIWLADDTLCGHSGALRLSGDNPQRGQLVLTVFNESANGTWNPMFDLELRKTEHSSMILWEGAAIPRGGGSAEWAYLQRPQSAGPNSLLDFLEERRWAFSVREQLGAEYEGAYYCGESGCDDRFVYVFVDRRNKEAFLRRLRMSNLDVLTYEELVFYNRHDSGIDNDCELTAFDKGFAPDQHICFKVEAVPLRSPEVTMALRSFPEVLQARRSGGEASTDSIGFQLATDAFLKDDRTMDGFKAAQYFDGAIRAYFPDSDQYEISEPVFQNNSLFWSIKGRRPALERSGNPSPDERREWWKVRIQLLIDERNYGSYYLVLGLPETKVTSWGFNEPPSDEKFTTEVMNDRRFVDLRQRLMGAVARGMPGKAFKE